MEKGGVRPVFFSDHEMVWFVIKGNTVKFGKGYWRMNIEVLKEKEFCEEYEVFFGGLEELKFMYTDVVGWWEMVKERSKAWIIRYCKRRTGKFWRQARDLQRELELKFEEYNVGATDDWVIINALKRQLRGIYEDQAKKFLFKIRQETREKGEGCTAALFRSVRDSKEKQGIMELKDKTGEFD